MSPPYTFLVVLALSKRVIRNISPFVCSYVFEQCQVSPGSTYLLTFQRSFSLVDCFNHFLQINHALCWFQSSHVLSMSFTLLGHKINFNLTPNYNY